MKLPVSSGTDLRRRRAAEDALEAVLARTFGYEDGPLFDRRRVSPALLDEFTRSDEVRRAAKDFVMEMMRRWKEMYPGKPALRLANKRVAPPFFPDFSPSTTRSPDGPFASSPQPVDLSQNAVPLSAPPMPTNTPVGSAPIHSTAKAGVIPSASSLVSAGPIERKVSFGLPNARCGEPYRAEIKGEDDLGHRVSVLDARVPAQPGLAFDPATGEMYGVPTQAGDYQVTVRWQDGRSTTRSGSFLLIVNANPRDLWKNLDPDALDPYFKPNEDSRFIKATGLRIAAGSKRGRSHAHAGSCRDDDFFVSHLAAAGWSVLVVADGAGSSKNSRKGAALAAEKAGSHLTSELSGDEGALLLRALTDWERDAGLTARLLKDGLYKLFGKAAWSALRAIEVEATAKACAIKDYSTTLLCAVHRRTANGVFVASFWLGDGAICAYGPVGHAKLLGKPDSGEFAGQTRFLDRATLSDPASVWDRIDFSRHEELTALILMTDGISDPRFETDNGLADAAKWESLWAEIGPALSAPDPGNALVEWMDFFTPGHHDDRTIALLW